MSTFKKVSPPKKPTGRGKLVKGIYKRNVNASRLPILSPCDRSGVDRSEVSNSKRKTREIPSDNEDETLADIRLKMCRMNADESDEDDEDETNEDDDVKTDEDDNDDFVDNVPSENKGKAKISELKPRKKRTSKTAGIPCIIHRTKLEAFLKYIKQMNEVQRKTIIDLRFGKLFDISVTRIPRWLVENYNPRKAKIFFPDGNHINVTEMDVEICLGFPRGPVEVEKISRL